MIHIIMYMRHIRNMRCSIYVSGNPEKKKSFFVNKQNTYDDDSPPFRRNRIGVIIFTLWGLVGPSDLEAIVYNNISTGHVFSNEQNNNNNNNDGK